ncbi:PadR family transcriptional regulator [Streptomyces sp. NPDC001935]
MYGHPILARLEQVGWVDSIWEDPTVHEEAGRPRRRFYRIAKDGAEQARLALARAGRACKQPLPGWAATRPVGAVAAEDDAELPGGPVG